MRKGSISLRVSGQTLGRITVGIYLASPPYSWHAYVSSSKPRQNNHEADIKFNNHGRKPAGTFDTVPRSSAQSWREHFHARPVLFYFFITSFPSFTHQGIWDSGTILQGISNESPELLVFGSLYSPWFIATARGVAPFRTTTSKMIFAPLRIQRRISMGTWWSAWIMFLAIPHYGKWLLWVMSSIFRSVCLTRVPHLLCALYLSIAFTSIENFSGLLFMLMFVALCLHAIHSYWSRWRSRHTRVSGACEVTPCIDRHLNTS